MSNQNMTNSDILPKPYVFPKSRTREDFDIRTPQYVRKYSSDRSVKRRSSEYTMQQARKDVEKRTRERAASNNYFNSYAKKKPKPEELRFEEVAVNDFREWKPEDESIVFNIRPGRRMFPFLKEVIKESDYYRKYGGDECENLRKPVTRRNVRPEDSDTPSQIVLTRNPSRFVCKPLDQDQIVEVI